MTPSPEEPRRRWMRVLACADPADLKAWFSRTGLPPFSTLRAPETGLVMLRGRAGGTGERFNLGEMTITRCAVRVGAWTGVAYVAGRDARHAELAAIADALLQDATTHEALERGLVAALAECQARRARTQQRQAAATRVDFHALARGEDA